MNLMYWSLCVLAVVLLTYCILIPYIRFVRLVLKPLDYEDHKINIKDLNPGDHLYVPGSHGIGMKRHGTIFYYHHGFYLGDNMISDFGAVNKTHPVARKLTDFLGPLGAEFLHRRTYQKCSEFAASLQMAHKISREKTWGLYNLASNNCEHYVTFLKTEKLISEQILLKEFEVEKFLRRVWPAGFITPESVEFIGNATFVIAVCVFCVYMVAALYIFALADQAVQLATILVLVVVLYNTLIFHILTTKRYKLALGATLLATGLLLLVPRIAGLLFYAWFLPALAYLFPITFALMPMIPILVWKFNEPDFFFLSLFTLVKTVVDVKTYLVLNTLEYFLTDFSYFTLHCNVVAGMSRFFSQAVGEDRGTLEVFICICVGLVLESILVVLVFFNVLSRIQIMDVVLGFFMGLVTSLLFGYFIFPRPIQ